MATIQQPPSLQQSPMQPFIDKIIKKIKDTSFRIGFGRKVRDQKQIRNRVRTFYKITENIRTLLTDILSTRDQFARSSSGSSEVKISKLKPLPKKLIQFGLNTTELEQIFTFLDEKKNKEQDIYKIYHNDLTNIIQIERDVLNYFERLHLILNPKEDMIKLYDDATKALEYIYYVYSQKIMYNSEIRQDYILNSIYLINNFFHILKFYTDKENNIKNINTKISTLKQNNINIKETITANEIQGLIQGDSKKDKISKLVSWFRKIGKNIFDAMQKYYYYDLKYKYTLSYKSLNNSYQKNILKGKRGYFNNLSGKLLGMSKYKSKVHLGPAYKISPILGGLMGKLGKVLWKFSDEELNKHYEDLKVQIDTYNGLLEPYNKAGSTLPKDLKFFEIKKRLDKEIRKLKIIKYFLLQKTIRLKGKKSTLGFTKKLVNTIPTLKEKIKEEAIKLTNNADKQKAISNILNKIDEANPDFDTILSLIKEQFKSIGGIGDGWKGVKVSALSALGFGKKSTIKRLKILKKMIAANTKVKMINSKYLEPYNNFDRTQSEDIKKKIVAQPSPILQVSMQPPSAVTSSRIPPAQVVLPTRSL